MKLTRDGMREILIATGVAGAGIVAAACAAVTVSSWCWAAVALLLILWLATLAFFRDPDRRVPDAPALLVSPADGTVTEITHLERHEEIDGPALRIGIFLSVFDVHVNRAPCTGRVVKTHYAGGRFLDARHPESGARNESNTIVIEPDGTAGGPVVVRQVAGRIARRIVCTIRSGDTVARGQRVGLIKFGSRTELIVPAGSGLEPVVRVNDHVKGGATVLMQPGRITDNDTDPGTPAPSAATPVPSPHRGPRSPLP